MCKYLLIAVVAALSLMQNLMAQCLGGCSAAANTAGLSSMSGIPERGKWIIGVSLLTMQYQPLTDEELLLYATPEASVYSVGSQGSLRGSLSYGLGKRSVLTAMFPYNFSAENREGHYHLEEQAAEIHNFGSIRGAGDAVLAFSYRLLDDQQRGWRAMAGAGIKMPTGTTDAFSTYAVVLPVHLQPGTGSWDPVIAANIQKSYGKLMLQSDARFRIATTAKDHNMGNYASAGILAGYEIISRPLQHVVPSIICSGGLTLDHNAPMRIMLSDEHLHGVDSTASPGKLIADPNSGFTRLSVNATINAYITRSIFIPLTFSVPLVQQLRGYQSASRFTASAGISFILN